MTTDGMCGVPHSFSGPGLWLDTITFTSCSVLIFSLFIITEVKKWSESCSGVSDSLRPHRLYSPWNSLGHNSGVGSLSLLPGIFPAQRSNPGLLHCRQILYLLSLKGSPRILEWVAYPFSRGSSWPRNRTGVSCIVGVFFTNWATRKVPRYLLYLYPKSKYTLVILEENEEYDSFKYGRLKIQT